jgi:hypothetical protein
MDIVNPRAVGNMTAVETGTTGEAAHLLGLDHQSNPKDPE